MPDIRPELSPKNTYWLEKHRYYELKHFCLQYPYWKKTVKEIDGMSSSNFPRAVSDGKFSNPTLKAVEMREEFSNKMILLQDSIMSTSPEFSDYIFKAVTEELSYDNLRLMHGLPCGREMWYELYRKFFYILSDSRK